MPVNIEIEAKTLLKKEEFAKVVDLFKDQLGDEVTQTNHYIDSKDMSLRRCGIGLIIRAKNGDYILNLKAPLSEGLLEKTQTISEDEYKRLKKDGAFPVGVVEDFLIMLGFNISELRILVSLKTRRREVEYLGEWTLSLDENSYLGVEDYELELKANSLENAMEVLEEICKKAKVPYLDNPSSKATRALNQLAK